MYTSKKTPVDPMREGHPEPFNLPRTIPVGWDMSEMLPASDNRQVEFTSANHDKFKGLSYERSIKTTYAV